MVAFGTRLSEEADIDIVLGPGEFQYTIEDEEHIIADYAASENSIFLLAFEGEELVGMLNIRGGKRKAVRHVGELGISIASGYRGQGIGTALMREAVHWARQTGILTRIQLFVFARNQRAIHLYENFGFKIEGTLHRAIFRGGEYLNDHIMALLID